MSQSAVIESTSRVASEVIVSQKPSLIGKTKEELLALVQELGEPAFRAEQLHHWLYVKCVRSYDEMSNLAKGFRQKLSERYQVGCLEIAHKQTSADGTIKYLFRLPDGKTIESVLIHFDDQDTYSLCISSQVGCAVDCAFCATGKLGFKRHLSTAEIVEQYLYVQADSGQEVRNIVFMGQGEPLLNYDNLLPAIRILNKSAEVGMRHITVSTSGIVSQIQQLAEEQLQLVLAISLHAPTDELRDQLVPINKKWPLAKLMSSLHHYVRTTGRRLTIEYVLLDKVNDEPEHAHQLVQLLKGLRCNVNLIPYNPIGDAYGFNRPSKNRVTAFKNVVAASGKKVTVRLERGVDIDAACGQLANKFQTQ